MSDIAACSMLAALSDIIDRLFSWNRVFEPVCVRAEKRLSCVPDTEHPQYQTSAPSAPQR